VSWILAILGFVIGAAIFYIVGQVQRRKDASAAKVDVGAARAEAEESIR